MFNLLHVPRNNHSIEVLDPLPSSSELPSCGVWSCAILGEDGALTSMGRVPVGLVEHIAAINCRIWRRVYYTLLVNVDN
jgi:hypothetical protein